MECYMCIFIIYLRGTALSYDDLSYKKITTQSSTSIFWNFDAENALDRNATTCTMANPIGVNNPDKTVWWKVDLGGVYNIYSINILFKSYDGYGMRQRGRFAGFSLYISDTGNIEKSTLCYKDGPELPPLNLTKVCAEYGRFVIFYNERLYAGNFPTGYELTNVYTELCEVIVHGCFNPGVYGTQCNIQCPINCEKHMCHIQNGTCFACEPGWIGASCEKKCANGKYGLSCKQICSEHCEGNVYCNYVTGQCDTGCAAGWTGSLCNKECENGAYGYNCANNCSGHCLNDSPCNKQTGHCDKGCKPGYNNVFCSEKCTSGYFGNGCGNLCNGHCINNGVCDHVRGVCGDGCQDGYIGKYCNNSCKNGYFGRNCTSVCSPNCKTCRHTDGHCRCSAGYTGYRCYTECFQSYGENCQYPCSQHCYNKNCDRFNGRCLTGCTDEFFGERCDKDIQMLREDSSSFISWIVGLSVSLAVNIIFITGICVMCRGKSVKKGSFIGNCLSCWKISEFYQDTNATIDETSTYQELAVTLPKPELPYHNTTLK